MSSHPTRVSHPSHPLMRAIHGENIYEGFAPTLETDLQGWNSSALVFQRAILETRRRVIIDVGVWKGASTLEFCRLQREHVVGGVVIAVDTFLGSPEHFGTLGDSLIARQYGIPMLYQQFLTNVVRSGLSESIIPVPQTSQNAASILLRLGIRAGLIHIDAAHEHAAVLADARAYWELLEPGGWLIGDDYHETWPGVVSGANQFAQETETELVIETPKWIARKPAVVC